VDARRAARPVPVGRTAIRWVTRLLLVAYFIEVGIILIVVPWSYPDYWERNVFVSMLPALEGFLRNPFVRGAASGVGVINVCAGLVELTALLVRITGGGKAAMTGSRPAHS
jgi:hypothetical protein